MLQSYDLIINVRILFISYLYNNIYMIIMSYSRYMTKRKQLFSNWCIGCECMNNEKYNLVLDFYDGI